MSLKVRAQALHIIQTLQAAGFEAYLVGGAVRDLLLAGDQEPPRSMDYDFTTSARPEDIQKLFPDSFYENTFGTVSVPHVASPTEVPDTTGIAATPSTRIIDLAHATKVHQSLSSPSNSSSTESAPTSTTITNSGLPHYQITTFRSDEVYDDFRRPTSMNWGTSLTQDLERRDFTINAMALAFTPVQLSSLLTQTNSSSEPVQLQETDYSLIDPHHGMDDLHHHFIRTVGHPETRFREDALRMLRAVRFSVQLNMQIEDHTFASIQQQASLVTNISGERIRDEVLKMLSSNYPAEAIELLDTTGLLPFILPELEETKGITQGGHHTTDVWTHSLDALRCCPSPDPIVRLATLLHDIAKPQTRAESGTTISFYNHEVIGARTAKAIAQRLRLSKKEVDRIFTLVRYHMFYYQPHNTDAAIRRFMRKVGLENIDDILDVREGDRLGSGARKTSWRLEEMKQRMIEQLNQPMSVTDLAINGNDLMTELGLAPGPQLGSILHTLFEEVLDNPELNTKDHLLVRAKDLARLEEAVG